MPKHNYNLGQGIAGKFKKPSVSLRNIFKLAFRIFLAEMSKFADRVVGWVHTNKSKH